MMLIPHIYFYLTWVDRSWFTSFYRLSLRCVLSVAVSALAFSSFLNCFPCAIVLCQSRSRSPLIHEDFLHLSLPHFPHACCCSHFLTVPSNGGHPGSLIYHLYSISPPLHNLVPCIPLAFSFGLSLGVQRR
jgi:hypothetical protein